jgi:hypothetical protein
VYLAGHILYLCGMAVLFFVVFMVTLGGSPPPRERLVGVGVGLLMIVCLLMVLSNWALAVVGTGFWVPAPVRYGARGLAVACLVLGALTLLEVPGIFLRLAEGVRAPTQGRPPLVGPGPMPAPELSHVLPSELLLLALLEVTRLALFPFFLRAVGRNLNAAALTLQGLSLGVGTVLLFAGTLGLDVLVLLFREAHVGPTFWRTDGGLNTLLLFINLLVPLAVLLWGVFVLQSARRTIRSKLRYM